MRKSFVTTGLKIFGVLGLTTAGMAAVYIIVDRTNGQIISGGEKRKYLLHVPKTYDASKPVPLVIAIHGFAEYPAHIKDYSRWNKLADEHGFLVVYPSGRMIPKRWNASGTGSSPLSDAQFISDLIEHLEQKYNIDRNRIFASGLSNGGGMVYMLACTLPERIAAVGGVAGAYLYNADACKPSRQVPMIIFHGTEDPVVPYHGGPSVSFQIPFPDVPEWVNHLAEKNGCQQPPTEFAVNGEVSGIRYDNCKQNADVEFYTIHGGGHSWPGGKVIPKFLVGHTSKAIDATKVMWEFFERHPLSGDDGL